MSLIKQINQDKIIYNNKKIPLKKNQVLNHQNKTNNNRALHNPSSNNNSNNNNKFKMFNNKHKFKIKLKPKTFLNKIIKTNKNKKNKLKNKIVLKLKK